MKRTLFQVRSGRDFPATKFFFRKICLGTASRFFEPSLKKYRSGVQVSPQRQAVVFASAAPYKKAPLSVLFCMAQRTRLELATSRVTGGCSNQLSYHCNIERIAEKLFFFNHPPCVGGEN